MMKTKPEKVATKYVYVLGPDHVTDRVQYLDLARLMRERISERKPDGVKIRVLRTSRLAKKKEGLYLSGEFVGDLDTVDIDRIHAGLTGRPVTPLPELDMDLWDLLHDARSYAIAKVTQREGWHTADWVARRLRAEGWDCSVQYATRLIRDRQIAVSDRQTPRSPWLVPEWSVNEYVEKRKKAELEKRKSRVGRE